MTPLLPAAAIALLTVAVNFTWSIGFYINQGLKMKKIKKKILLYLNQRLKD